MISGLRTSHARWRRHAICLALATVALAGCDATSSTGATQTASAAPGLQAVIVSSASSSGPCGGVACGVVGPNQRIGLLVTDPSGGVISGATVIAQVFTVPTSGGQAQAIGPQQKGSYHGQGIESPDKNINRGVYTIYQTFDKPGQYHVAVQADKDGVKAQSDLSYLVLGQDPGIAVGAPAPRSENPTASQVSDIGTIDTGSPPSDMHYTSIAAAIAAHHVTAIYMGTPGFCQSRTCAPELNAVKAVEAPYRARGVDFVHIEVYKGGRPDNADFSKATLSPTFTEWKLDTEPWVMLVDRGGNLAYKFSGATGGDEIAAALDKLLA
ncbi:MAG: hypothetical protein WBD38_02510 [Candidatus Dormiibacterota bacterium]